MVPAGSAAARWWSTVGFRQPSPNFVASAVAAPGRSAGFDALQERVLATSTGMVGRGGGDDTLARPCAAGWAPRGVAAAAGDAVRMTQTTPRDSARSRERDLAGGAWGGVGASPQPTARCGGRRSISTSTCTVKGDDGGDRPRGSFAAVGGGLAAVGGDGSRWGGKFGYQLHSFKGGGPLGWRNGPKYNPGTICLMIRNTDCVRKILSIIGDHPLKLNVDVVEAALLGLGDMARTGNFAEHPRYLTSDTRFQELLRLTRGFSKIGKLDNKQKLCNIARDLGRLHEAKRLDAADDSLMNTLTALKAPIERSAHNMTAQNLAHVIWMFAMFKVAPGDDMWAALEAAAPRVENQLKSQAVTRIAWAYAKLGRQPGKRMWAALDTAVAHVVKLRFMLVEDVTNVTLAYAELGRAPRDTTMIGLEHMAGRIAHEEGMDSKNLTNLMWAHAKLGRMPCDLTWGAFDSTAGEVTRDMNASETANVMWAYATFGRLPSKDTFYKLSRRTEAKSRDMNPRNLACVAWAFSTLSALSTLSMRDGVDHPWCYPSIWDKVGGFNAEDFSPEEKRMLFQAFLLHHLTTSSGRPTVNIEKLEGRVPVEVAYPAWLTVDARDAWKRDVQVKAADTPGPWLQQLASVVGQLGLQHEVYRVTGDGYFCMDIYLPEYDVAVEFNYKTQYYKGNDISIVSRREANTERMHYTKRNDDGSFSVERDASTTKTAETKLRGFFLAKRCAKVVTVPYFEYEKCITPEERMAYVKQRLSKEAGVEV